MSLLSHPGSAPLLALNWPDLPAGVRAAFMLRGPVGRDTQEAGRAPRGGLLADECGASAGPYARFNLATHVGDEPDAVDANRRLLRAALGLPGEPGWLRQVHGRRVCDLDAAGAAPEADAARATAHADAMPEADAAVTRAPGRVCVIQVADCLPVLFADASGTRVGAAHAGWRGLCAGILEATIGALGLPAGDLVAWIGPGIGPAHFEVGDEVREAFVRTDPAASAAFVRNERARWQCDLAGIAARRLRAAGVASVSVEPACTYAEPQRFYSYRRDGQCGRMAALIWLDSGRGGARLRGTRH